MGAELDAVEAGAVTAGSYAQWRPRIGALLFLALAASGVVRIVVVAPNGLLVALTALAVVLGLLLWNVPRVTPAGAKVRQRFHTAHPHLAPSQSAGRTSLSTRNTQRWFRHR